jgi:alcohol dehydrogenase class IV
VFAFTAPSCPGRHLLAAEALGADVAGASEDDAGAVLAARLVALMRATGIPSGLAALGYTKADTPALTDGAFPQRRLFANAPREITRDDLQGLFTSAMAYW